MDTEQESDCRMRLRIRCRQTEASCISIMLRTWCRESIRNPCERIGSVYIVQIML